MPRTLDALKDDRIRIRAHLRKAQQARDKVNVTKYQEKLKEINETIAQHGKRRD
ncbi:MAG: hypothetical protein ACFFB3_02715 [Candidatus Hodarchaeota archaeon]